MKGDGSVADGLDTGREPGSDRRATGTWMTADCHRTLGVRFAVGAASPGGMPSGLPGDGATYCALICAARGRELDRPGHRGSNTELIAWIKPLDARMLVFTIRAPSTLYSPFS